MQALASLAGEAKDELKSLEQFKIGEMKFPETKIGQAMETKIGESVTAAQNWFAQRVEQLGGGQPELSEPAATGSAAAGGGAEDSVAAADQTVGECAEVEEVSRRCCTQWVQEVFCRIATQHAISTMVLKMNTVIECEDARFIRAMDPES